MQTKKSNSSAKEIDGFIAQAKIASSVLKSLSHETRLLILCLLTDGEKPVSEIEEFLGLPQASVSQQLARLRFDQLVSSRRDGRYIYYKISNKEVATLIAALYDIYCKPKASD